MPDVPLEAEKLKLLEKILDWLAAGPNSDSWTAVLSWFVIVALILLVGLVVLFWAINAMLETLAKAIDAYQKSGLPVTFVAKNGYRYGVENNFVKYLTAIFLH